MGFGKMFVGGSGGGVFEGRSRWRESEAGGTGAGRELTRLFNKRGSRTSMEPAPLGLLLQLIACVSPACDAEPLPMPHRQARPLPSPTSMARARQPDLRDENP